MNAKTLQDLDRRLRTLERSAVKLRKGEITSDGLVLGGAACDTSAPIPSPPVVGPPPEVGDTVTVLTGGNQAVALGKLGNLIIPSVASLPASAPNGSVIAFQGNWVCRYSNAAPDSRFPWAVLFGPTRTDFNNSAVTASGGSFTAPANPLSVSMPPGTRGIVDVTVGAEINKNNTGDGWGILSYTIGGVSASDDWSISHGNAMLSGGANNILSFATVAATSRHTVLTGGASFSERVRVNGSSCRFSRRSLILSPVWIGP